LKGTFVKGTLKHRLIGAAVLAAVAILFLPSFFKEKQTAAVSKKTQIPPRPSLAPVEFNAPEPVLGVEPAPVPETMFIPESGVAADEMGQPKATSSPALTDTPTMPLNSQGLPDAWVVQVGSFSAKEAAIKLRDDLQAEGFKAYVRTIPNGNGSVSRVFIGPKLDKSQAQWVKTQIDKRLKVNSILMRFNP
jgi:DedD protein